MHATNLLLTPGRALTLPTKRNAKRTAPLPLPLEGLSLAHNSMLKTRESQRDSVSKPRVARREHTLGMPRVGYQPQRGCVRPLAPGWRNPVGVDRRRTSFPRVARASQPWAGGHNPFGNDTGC